MPDDEPLDDARAVAMTAAASAARVIETAARQARENADRNRAQVERRTEQAQAEAALRTLGSPGGGPSSGPANGPSWDAQRSEREAARQSMTPEAREAFRVADLSSGTDPALAAATPVKQRRAAAAQVPAVKAPEVTAGR